MVSLAKVSESLGFTHAWVGDSHLIWREAYVTLAAAAVGTSRLVLGTGVTNVLTRDPSVVASTFSTLQEAFPRRLILGLGLGDSAVETMGKKPARLADFELAVRRMRDLLNGRDVAIDTGTIHMKHGARDRVPIYFAASGPKMLELAGRIADGVIILVGVDPPRVRQALDTIEVGVRAAGRTLADIDLVLWVPCAVADAGARDAVKATSPGWWRTRCPSRWSPTNRRSSTRSGAPTTTTSTWSSGPARRWSFPTGSSIDSRWRALRPRSWPASIDSGRRASTRSRSFRTAQEVVIARRPFVASRRR